MEGEGEGGRLERRMGEIWGDVECGRWRPAIIHDAGDWTKTQKNNMPKENGCWQKKRACGAQAFRAGQRDRERETKMRHTHTQLGLTTQEENAAEIREHMIQYKPRKESSKPGGERWCSNKK